MIKSAKMNTVYLTNTLPIYVIACQEKTQDENTRLLLSIFKGIQLGSVILSFYNMLLFNIISYIEQILNTLFVEFTSRL